MGISTIKLSSPETGDFWEVPVLFEDEHLLAIDKPAGVLTSPDRNDPKRPSLMKLLHRGIERGAPWAKERGISYLANAHRVDENTSGVLLFARSKAALVSLAVQFGSEKGNRIYHVLVRGVAALGQTEFKTDAKIALHPLMSGVYRVDLKLGKRARTEFTVLERFQNGMLVECRPLTDRPHQVPVHLKHVGFRLIGDEIYGGAPLFLSSLKPDYRQKKTHEERPLIGRPAIHLCRVTFNHPVSGAETIVESPLAKDFAVSLKYLRRYSSGAESEAPVQAY